MGLRPPLYDGSNIDCKDFFLVLDKGAKGRLFMLYSQGFTMVDIVLL